MTEPIDFAELLRDSDLFDLSDERPVCETCGAEGCVCEWCDDCEANVNCYEHFLEWNPEGGVHISDVALRGFVEGVL